MEQSAYYNKLVRYIHDRELRFWAAMYFRGNLIDIGCGSKPYKDLLDPYVTQHIGIDHMDSSGDKSSIDLIGTAYNIPVADATFDSAVCTAVLEHLEEPEQALRECYRLLKSGGVAIYSVPFIWHVHEEPRDFYRFSKFGLKYIFEKVGFEIVELKALSGFWVTFGQLLVYNLHRFNFGPLRWLRIINAVALLIQATSYGLDKLDKAEQFTWMYMVVARKR
jgi:SAM-dependent methyltransferase